MTAKTETPAETIRVAGRECQFQECAGGWFVFSRDPLVNLTTDGEWSRERYARYFYANTEAAARAFAADIAAREAAKDAETKCCECGDRGFTTEINDSGMAEQIPCSTCRPMLPRPASPAAQQGSELPDGPGTVWGRNGEYWMIGREVARRLLLDDALSVSMARAIDTLPRGNWHKLAAPAEQGEVERADVSRIVEWWYGENPKSPALAFTAGPERTIADLLWAAKAICDGPMQSAIVATEAKLAEAEREVAAAKNSAAAKPFGPCEVCWTNSWVPVPADDPDAQALLDGSGYVRCDHCWLEGYARSLRVERDDASAELAAANERLAAMRTEIKQLADDAYCTGIQIARRTECLGWEAKVKAGQFGKPEFDAHSQSATEFGKHVGLMTAHNMLAALNPTSSPPAAAEEAGT